MPRQARVHNVVRIQPTEECMANTAPSSTRLRVAAYCRVSTELEEQQSSYEVQVDYYTAHIQNNPEWIYAGIYADEGISGTSTRKRDNFKRMIRDCMAGKIDMVITKSISRFARNTLDCLAYVRQLKERGIAVYFEKENLNTMDPTGEMVLTILSSLAQEESRSISTNVHWGIVRRYEKGEVKVNVKRFLGYTRNQDRELIIDVEEAIAVRRIFRYTLEGYGTEWIKRRMEEDGFQTGAGGTRWWPGGIERITDNEKYMGDALLQKTFTEDYLTKKRVKNTGQLQQFYVTDFVEPIIPRQIFYKIQEEKGIRRAYTEKKKSKSRTKTSGKHQTKYALADIMICAECGHFFRRVTWTNRQGQKIAVWRCMSRLENGTTYCHNSPTILEKNIQRSIMQTLGSLIPEEDTRDEILKERMLDNVAVFYEAYSYEEIERILAGLSAKMTYYQGLDMTGQETDNETDIGQVWKKMRIIKEEMETVSEAYEKIKEYHKCRDSNLLMDENYANRYRYRDYNESMVRRLIKRIEIKTKEKYNIILKSGQTMEVSMEEDT